MSRKVAIDVSVFITWQKTMQSFAHREVTKIHMRPQRLVFDSRKRTWVIEGKLVTYSPYQYPNGEISVPVNEIREWAEIYNID